MKYLRLHMILTESGEEEEKSSPAMLFSWIPDQRFIEPITVRSENGSCQSYSSLPALAWRNARGTGNTIAIMHMHMHMHFQRLRAKG